MPDPESTKILLDVARSLNAATDFEQLMDEIIAHSTEVIGCEVCSILFPSETQADHLVIRSTMNRDSPIEVPVEGSIAGEVFRSRKLSNIDDVQKYQGHNKKAASRTGLVTHSMLTAPLLDGDSCIGVLQAINPTRGEMFCGDSEETIEIFASLISISRIRILGQETAIREAATRRELDLAHEIQESFLPPERDVVNGYRIEAFYQTATEVGGDFYFWESLPGGRALAGIADVTGKGVAAALDMARGSTMITAKAPLLSEMDLGDWVSLLNDELYETMTQGRFIAGTFVLLDPKEGTISSVAAGQFVPKILTSAPKPEWSDVGATPNPPLGIAPGFKMKDHTVSLEGVRGILVYSDGLFETQAKDGEQFGDKQFERSLLKAARGQPHEIMKALRDTWCAWFYDATYLDDTTAIVIHTEERLPDKEFRFDCAPEVMENARHFVDGWVTHAGFDEKEAGLVTLAFDEVVTNIFKYAYDAAPREVACKVYFDDDDFVIRLKHWGRGIGDGCDKEPCLPGSEALGGRGMYVIQNVFDSVEYDDGPHQAEVVLRKARPK